MPFAATQPLEAALQMVAFDVSLPDGAAISAPVEITVRPRPACVVEAVGANNFNGDPNGAFWRLHNLGERGDVLDATFDFRNAADPGQASIYYDLDQSGLGDNFYCGNGTQAGCRGSYRLGSDTTVGLIYDALNTYAPGALLNPCDPTVSCGFTVIAPGPSAHTARALQFRFAHFSAGESFLFAADTDYGLGEHGAAMRGLHITLQTTTGSLCGSLVADPFDPLRAFVELY